MAHKLDRRQFLQTAAIAAIPPISGNRLNVLHVMADQHQAACMGNEGYPQALTPNIDRLAREGVRFASCYTQHPIYTPSRTSILSGQYCHNHGYYGLNGPPPRGDLPSFMSHFRQRGYRTAAFGKVHTPDEPQPQNWLHGHVDLLADCYLYFDYPPYLSERYSNYLKKLGLQEKEDSAGWPEYPGQAIDINEGRPSMIPYRHSVEGWSVTEAIKFMDSSADRPFCVQVNLPRPH